MLKFTKQRTLLALFVLAVLGIFVASADSCSGATNPSANNTETNHQASQQEIYNQGQPVPLFPYSNYRQELIQLQNQLATGRVATWTVYSLTMNGDLYVCKSQGWPIPVTAQLSNPLQPSRDGNYTGGGAVAVGQMDPIGIYPPPSGAGTWVFCLDNAGVAHPLYAEGFVTAFSYPVVIDQNGKVQQVGEPSSDSAIQNCNYNAALKKCAPTG